MKLLNAVDANYRTVRRLLAKALNVPEAMNAKSSGIYAYHYGHFIMVRVYRNVEGVHTKVFEERVKPSEFVNEELLAKLMLAT